MSWLAAEKLAQQYLNAHCGGPASQRHCTLCFPSERLPLCALYALRLRGVKLNYQTRFKRHSEQWLAFLLLPATGSEGSCVPLPRLNFKVPRELRTSVQQCAKWLLMDCHFSICDVTCFVVLVVVHLSCMSSYLYWPTMYTYLLTYCNTCTVCQKTSAVTQKSRPPLQPLPWIFELCRFIAMDIMGHFLLCAITTPKGIHFLSTLLQSWNTRQHLNRLRY